MFNYYWTIKHFNKPVLEKLMPGDFTCCDTNLEDIIVGVYFTVSYKRRY